MKRSLLSLALVALAPAAVAEPPASAFIETDQVTWKVNAHNVARWKTLIGGIEGGQLPAKDVQFGVWQLAPGAIYHGHRHAAPEIYHILSGRALWTVGDETREVGAGVSIYTRPGQVHRMENLGDEPVHAIWFWWAPGGDTEVFKAPYEFTEPAPDAPNGTGFAAPAERLH